MALGAVELDDLLVFIIPEGKFLQPFSNEGVFLHVRKRPALIFILSALAADQTLKARKTLRRVVQHSVVDWDRIAPARRDQLLGLRAVCLVDKLIVLLDQFRHILGRFPVLPAQGSPQIGQYLGLRQFFVVPLLVVHVVRLLLCIEAVQIFAAFCVSVPHRRVSLDLIE